MKTLNLKFITPEDYMIMVMLVQVFMPMYVFETSTMTAQHYSNHLKRKLKTLRHKFLQNELVSNFLKVNYWMDINIQMFYDSAMQELLQYVRFVQIVVLVVFSPDHDSKPH
jgi:hypothetical protein